MVLVDFGVGTDEFCVYALPLLTPSAHPAHHTPLITAVH